LKCVPGPTDLSCMHCARRCHVCKLPGGSCGSPVGASLLAPSLAPPTSSSSVPSPSLVVAVVVPLFAAAVPVAATSGSVTLPTAVPSEFAAYGCASYWGGELARAEAAVATATAQVEAARQQYALALSELVVCSLVRGSSDKGKGKAKED
jgi:hypothetical protein